MLSDEDIAGLAEKSGLVMTAGQKTGGADWLCFSEQIKRFARLVEDEATDAANTRSNRAWALMCEKRVNFERERCARLVEDISDDDWQDMLQADCAEAIRDAQDI